MNYSPSQPEDAFASHSPAQDMPSGLWRSKRLYKSHRLITVADIGMRYSPAIAAQIGDRETIFLLQLEYWLTTSGEMHNGHLCLGATLTDLQQYFEHWPRVALHRIIKKLQKLGLVFAYYDQGARCRGQYIGIVWEKVTELPGVTLTPAAAVSVATSAPSTQVVADTDL